MFKKRRERKQAELHEQLAGALRDPDTAVRAKAATTAAESARLEWALRELAQAVAREPWTDDFDETVVDGFAVTLRRDPAVRERAERIITEHLTDPEGFLRAWTGFVAEIGGPPALGDIGEDLRDDMRERLTYLRGEGWTPEGPDGFGRPGTFARDLAFDLAVMLASLVLRRNEPLSAAETEQVRTGMRAALAEALPLAPGGTERAKALGALTKPPQDGSWTEHARVGVMVDEALEMCADADQDRMALGIETLSLILLLDGVFRYGPVKKTLDRLAGGEPDALVLREVLSCYDYLHTHKPLDEPPLALFLEGLRHADVGVRKAAVEGLNPMAEGSPAEKEAVDGLVDRLEHDEDTAVRESAARTLVGLDCAEEGNALAASDALERSADSPVPALRALSLRDALRRGIPDAYDRILHELESPDPHWEFVWGLADFLDGEIPLPDDIRPRLIERLERLSTSGWTGRCDDPDGYPDAEDRAEKLPELLKRLRAEG
ncbi:hypothetical protein AB0B50_06170 [Streptomyces sp. NPDC041068]|uniref:HEAT repeat domain-containing protein n=1 Tax=Streptomyces sp. NPDC041068 TaxID=3155130 RepID=UPI0033CB8351